MRRGLSVLAITLLALTASVPEATARGRRHARRACCPPCRVICWPCEQCVSGVPPGASISPTSPRLTWASASRYDQPGVPARVIRSAKGRTYRAIATTEKDRFEHAPASIPPGIAEAARAAPGDIYIGHDRKAAKLSVASGSSDEFPLVQNVLATLRPDDEMRHYHPPITRDADSERVTEEQRNVAVDAYLYAAKKESNDNDFHLILGDDPSLGDGPYMNAEISGLPTDGPFRSKLTTARGQFKDLINLSESQLPGTGQYERYEPPIPVRVSGSLFYDVDHLPGAVGPAYAKPDTAWEIHPITAIAER
jgi:hypothetical protein